MSSGKKKSTKVKIDAPPQIQQVDFSAPTGDRFLSKTQGNSELFESVLSPQTQGTVNESLNALQNLANEINNPDANRLEEIRQRSQDFYDLQAQGINESTDDTLASTQSSLGKRFGGAYNATFGADLLARIEKNRSQQLASARKEAALFGEDLYQSDEDSRLRRFTMFQNYLTDLNNQARGFQGMGGEILANDRQRATSLALERAKLALQAASLDQRARQSRTSALASALGGAASLAALALPGVGPVAASMVGTTVGGLGNAFLK